MIAHGDVTSYTAFDAVKGRTPEQLTMDIVQAKMDIFRFCGHKFTDPKYTPLPDEVKLAFIKVAEWYALKNSDEASAKGYKSEKIGDYSYTIGEGNQAVTFSLSALLIDHIQAAGNQGMRFKMGAI